ncbi:sensor histidine kinase [Paenibacillus spongiae]|uniref:histidine kinase n=1 Tax=Paenibacillus spongiae TaxID=2909671 RepID=A0ABY5S5F1_9BACL|nr:sensor histidine kinase [Paenibacillus spongiae]UVI29141.1 sensor histidine kinase [Paenibacillus spongiae]
MPRLTRWISSLSIALKHFLFLFIGTLLLYGLLAWLNLKDAEQLFRKQVVSDAEIIIDRTNLYLNAYLDNVQSILLLLSARSDLLDEGKEDEAVKLLRQYAAPNSTLYRTLYLVRTDGKVLSNTQVNFEIMGNPALGSLLEQARSSYGVFITEPYESPLSGRTVAFVLPIAGKDRSFKGMAVVEIDLNKLTGLLATFMNTKNQTFAIVTGKGNAVQSFETSLPLSFYRLLPYHTDVFPPRLDSSFLAEMTNLKTGVSQIDGPTGKLVAVKAGMNRLGWHFIAFYEDSYFYQNITALYRNYGNVALVWVVLLLFGSYLLSRYFAHPIRTLVAKMNRVREVEVLSGITVNRNDEIGKLAKSYNAMMERIQHLVHEIKEAETRKQQYELKMLQSQIAPHFLYNTLACISSLAKQQKTGAVRETIKSLVGLLSFSFDKKSEFVTLEEELEGLRMYVHIQQVRYGDKFAVQLDTEPAALRCVMLKLTLQPLVENAIFHGLAPLKREGTIRIRTKLVRGRLVIIMRDNGAGMDAARLESVFLERRKAPSNKHRFTGIGVMNVHERIRLHYGEPYGLRIFSLPDIGTLIRIELPASLHDDMEAYP